MTFDFVWNPFWQRTSAVLVHFVWQAAAAAVVVGLLLAVWRPRRPQARYAACLMTFLALPFGAVLTFLVAGVEQPVSASLASSGTDERNAGVAAGRGGAAAVPEPMSVLSSLTQWLDRARPWLILGWLAGVGLFSLRLACGAAAIAWIRRRAACAPADLLERTRRLSGTLGVRLPRVIASHHVRQALAAGLFRPVIVLPASWVTGLSPEMAEAVLAHELAHLRRHDVWLNTVQRIVETVFFYHPAVWWLSNRVRVERELCCDELAVAATGDRLAYATALELAVRDSCPARGLILANGIGGRQMAVLDRVRHVLNLEPGGRRRGWWPGGVAVLAVPAVAWCAAATWQPARAENAEVAFVQDDEREGDEARGAREERGPQRDEREEEARDREDARRDDARREEGERREIHIERARDPERHTRLDFERRDDTVREADEREGAEQYRRIERREIVRRGQSDDERPRDADREDAQSFPRRPELDPEREWPREGRIEIEFERRGDMPPPQRELLEMVRQLRREVEDLRQEVRELRGDRPAGPVPPGRPRFGDVPPRDRDGDRGPGERVGGGEGPRPPGPPDRPFLRGGFRPPIERERDARDRPDEDRRDSDDSDEAFRPRPPGPPDRPYGPPGFRPPRDREPGAGDRGDRERPDADRDREDRDDARERERDRPDGDRNNSDRPADDRGGDDDRPERDGETAAGHIITPAEAFSFFLGLAR